MRKALTTSRTASRPSGCVSCWPWAGWKAARKAPTSSSGMRTSTVCANWNASAATLSCPWWAAPSSWTFWSASTLWSTRCANCRDWKTDPQCREARGYGSVAAARRPHPALRRRPDTPGPLESACAARAQKKSILLTFRRGAARMRTGPVHSGIVEDIWTSTNSRKKPARP